VVDVICMGELLIDFVPTQSGVSLVQAPAFKKAPGGAPANVAVGLAKLGVKSGFMGKVGDDDFGRFLAQTLADNGVDITALVFSDVARTALAFVSLTAEGERDFMFYRHPSADMLFEPAEVDEASISQAEIFHYGSISLISEPSRSATLHAVDVAVKNGLIISYDPNLRLPLWPGEEEARAGMMAGWRQAHLIKASAEEITFLTGEHSLSRGVAQLWHPELRLAVVTLGEQGCHYYTQQTQGHVPGFSVQTIDTTGAGDGFVAGLLSRALARPAIWQDVAALEDALRVANAVGALTTTQLGAIPALPDMEAVERLL
jgi:fructokinase